jgi:hypothetical protein
MTEKIIAEKHPYEIGAKYLIRTITMIYTGKLVKVFDKELVFTNCSWIPETERWNESVRLGIFKEVEPYPFESEVIINRESILDIVKVNWNLPDKVK